MRFLLTNDDGFGSEGITALEGAAAQLGEVSVVAPDLHLSGCSHQITDKRPIRVTPRGPARYTIDAFPADCVRIAAVPLALEFDWVLSGVNHGGNMGVDLFLSGTVAAVREAVLLGYPAIAFSQYRRNRHVECDWTWTQRQVERVLPFLMTQTLAPGHFWNVNFPHPEVDHDPAWVFCNPEQQPLQLRYKSNDQEISYVGSYQERPRNAGSDAAVCFGGQIAISMVPVFAPAVHG